MGEGSLRNTNTKRYHSQVCRQGNLKEMPYTNLDNFHRNERFFARLDRMKAKPWQCVLLSLVMVFGDYLSGSRVQFPFLYVIPVSMAAWGGNKTLAYSLSFLLPATRILMTWFWELPLSPYDLGINLLIRVVVLVGLVYLLLSLQNVRLLKGMLHTCSYCHRIETSNGEWKPIEQFMVEHSEAVLSHGVCPECADKYWGNLMRRVTKS